MHVALLTTFAVTKKEPLAVVLERIHAAFLCLSPLPPGRLRRRNLRGRRPKSRPQ